MPEGQQSASHPPQPSRLRQMLMKFFGPADLGPEHHVHPLRGTKYDPEIQRRRKEQRRAERAAARERRRGGGSAG